jgi:hypothetical protein
MIHPNRAFVNLPLDICAQPAYHVTTTMPLTNELYPDRLGFVYVIQSRFMPGIVKIGATRQHPLRRTKELSAPTGVPGEYELAYYHSYSDCFAAESLAHDHFATRRINESREFFEVHVDEAIALLESLSSSTAYRDRVEAEQYDDYLEGNPIVGGAHQRRAVKPVATPFAELFATFEDRGDGVLNEAERAQCRALEKKIL